MWSAVIDSVSATAGTVQVVVTFSNSEPQPLSLTETYNVASASQVNQTIINRIEQMDAADLAASQIPLGPVIVPPPEPTPEPPPPNPKYDAFIPAWVTLQRLQQAVDMGVIPTTDPTYVAAQQTAQANFESSFIL